MRRQRRTRLVKAPICLPPTRTHHQLAKWINLRRIFNVHGQQVAAVVDSWRASTDTKIGRLRIAGKGRQGLRLRIRVVGVTDLSATIYEHRSSETYRRHDEAREWVEKNLHWLQER